MAKKNKRKPQKLTPEKLGEATVPVSTTANNQQKTGFVSNPLFHIGLLAIVGLAIYSNTFAAPFVLDDDGYILNNLTLRDFQYFLHPSLVKSFIKDNQNLVLIFNNRYVGFLSFALNYRLHGASVTGYHVVNLLIHMINAGLVYWLVIMTFRAPYFKKQIGAAKVIAFFTAALFMCHPLQTQAVTYISQRFVSLATLFYLLSLAMYVKSRFYDAGKIKWGCYAAGLLSAVLAMKTKEIAITMPVMILLYEFMFFKGDKAVRFRYVAPFLLTMLIIPLTLIFNPSGDSRSLAEAMNAASRGTISRWPYLFTEFVVIIKYLQLLVFPVNQNVEYDFPVYKSILEPASFVSFLALASLFGLGVYLYRRTDEAGSPLRVVSFGIFWFFVALSVESSFIPIQDVIFEHRVYLPSPGFFLAIVTAAMMLRENSAGKLVIPALGVAVILLCVATYQRNTVWMNDETLWLDVISKNPKAYAAYDRLGIIYKNQKRYDEAEKAEKASLTLAPRYARAHNNLGVVYHVTNRPEQAIAEYNEALKLDPNITTAHNNLGALYQTIGRVDEAIRELETLLKGGTSYTADAATNLGAAYERAGRLEDAEKQYITALRINPNLPQAHNNLGNLYKKTQRYSQAVSTFETAARLLPNSAVVRNNLEEARRLLESASADGK